MDIEAVLKTLWFTPGVGGRWGLPIILEGLPGTAKSSRAAQVAGRCGLPIEVVLGSLREPSDFLGLPIPDGDRVRYAPPSWAVRIAEEERGVVFNDEINTCPPAVQAALLRATLEGVVGELVLPPGIRFVAAQNAVEDAAGGYDLAPPLANRFGHIAYQPDLDNFLGWLVGGQGIEAPLITDVEKEERRVLAAFPEPHAKAVGLVAGFLRRRPELAVKKPASGDPQASKAWPSWRTWDMASRAQAGAEVHGLGQSDGEELLAAFVGTGAASEFVDYLTKVDLPNPSDILSGKVKFVMDDRLDRTDAILSSCTALVLGEKDTKVKKERASALWGVLGVCVDQAADIAVPAASALVKAGLTSVKDSQAVLAKIEPIYSAAGA